MNDYLNYLNGFNDMNYMTNPNKMIGDLNYQGLMPNYNQVNNVKSDINGLADSYKGFKRGNMFDNLYDPYKNYKPMELKANSEREDMLMQLQELDFALIELGLYLDVNDNDKVAIKVFNDYQMKAKELCKMYESKYGPRTFDSMQYGNTWTWDNGPWPWEVQR